jgi:nitrogen-specific signal transduction histidine kinase
MRVQKICWLYTQDEALVRRITGALALCCEVRVLEKPLDLERRAAEYENGVLLMDARGLEFSQLLPDLCRPPHPVVIVLGTERSDPVRYAQSLGVFSVEPLNPDFKRLQSVLFNAFAYGVLRRENRMLQQELDRIPEKVRHPVPAPSRKKPPDTLQHFSRALQNFGNLAALYQSMMEGLAAAAKVSRAGLFSSVGKGGVYCFRSGVRCLEGTHDLHFSEREAFVRWMEINAHLVSRLTLDTIPDAENREMLRQVLDRLGAEIIIPLTARQQIKGWVFIGQRVTGLPFTCDDFEELTAYVDHISNTLENALSYQDTALQKALAETVLDSIPSGITAIGEDGAVRWMNQMAADLLDMTPAETLGMPVELLGSRLADLLRRALRGEEIRQAVEWVDPATQRLFSTETRQLVNQDVCVGSVALIHDISQLRQLEEKQAQMERAAFWNELAASMAHEIRNPLVAIKTFAQLLPEHYQDEEFRNEFSKNVLVEIDRLNGIVDQIHSFAHPAPPEFGELDLRKALEKGVKQALSHQSSDGLDVKVYVEKNLPPVHGDENSLIECVAHLVQNAIEALQGRAGAKVELTAKPCVDEQGRRTVLLSVCDNGKGIDPEIRGNVFSPFCTTKARGMGLGLPIVKRTVIDHNGRIHLDSGRQGTRLSITLPVHQESRRPVSDAKQVPCPE